MLYFIELELAYLPIVSNAPVIHYHDHTCTIYPESNMQIMNWIGKTSIVASDKCDNPKA